MTVIRMNFKFINFAGCSLLLLFLFVMQYSAILNPNSSTAVFMLPYFQSVQLLQFPIYASIIVSAFIKSSQIVMLPLNFYILTISSNLTIICMNYLNANGHDEILWVLVYGLGGSLLCCSIVVIFDTKSSFIESDGKREDILLSMDRVQNRKKVIRKQKRRNNRKSKGNKEESIDSFDQRDRVHREIITNVIMCNLTWHIINFCLLVNKHVLHQYMSFDYDVLLSLMWLYWTMEYYSYQFNLSTIITVDNNIILPYILIIGLLFEYEMFILLRIFCVVICLSMIAYKSFGIYHHCKFIKPSAEFPTKPILIYSNERICIDDDDDKLSKLIRSLPLKYFFYSSFSSFGVSLVPSIISVFWRVWHLIPLLVNGKNADANAMKWLKSFTLHQKVIITLMQFVQSMLIMYIVVKQYRLYIMWKYYKMIDISATLFVFGLNVIISKLPFVVWTVCFFRYFVFQDGQMDILNPELTQINPPKFILFAHYIGFSFNCWVVYYKFMWKNGESIYKIRRSIADRMQIKAFHGNDVWKLVATGVWIHFCARILSVFLNDTTIEKFHIMTSIALLSGRAHHEVVRKKSIKSIRFTVFCILLLALTLLLLLL